MYAKVQHTMWLEAVADQRVREFTEGHGPALLAEFNEQEGGAATAAWNSAVGGVREAAGSVLAREHRREQLGAPRNDSLAGAINHVLSVHEGIEVTDG